MDLNQEHVRFDHAATLEHIILTKTDRLEYGTMQIALNQEEYDKLLALLRYIHGMNEQDHYNYIVVEQPQLLR